MTDPAQTERKSGGEAERGLLGNFIGANLGAQFEAMSCDWLNLGLQDPRITGSNDPVVGANDPVSSWFDVPLEVRRNDPAARAAAFRPDPRRRLHVPAEHFSDPLSWGR